MNEAPEDIHDRLDQLRLLVTETTDPLAERLVRDMIAELEDQMTADLSQPKTTGRRLTTSSQGAGRSDAPLLFSYPKR
jgi:hypothetical protein